MVVLLLVYITVWVTVPAVEIAVVGQFPSQSFCRVNPVADALRTAGKGTTPAARLPHPGQ
jgi:hypothetical protein